MHKANLKSADTHNKILGNLPTLPFRMLIKGYQVFLSPLLGQNCRFHPSCSCYAKEALEVHGLIKGLWLSSKRILKCQPMHPGGFDYVPKPNTLAEVKHRCNIKHKK